jgi:hypothetical protein
MLEATPPLPNTPSWRGAQFKKAWGQLYLLYTHHPIILLLSLLSKDMNYLIIILQAEHQNRPTEVNGRNI